MMNRQCIKHTFKIKGFLKVRLEVTTNKSGTNMQYGKKSQQCDKRRQTYSRKLTPRIVLQKEVKNPLVHKVTKDKGKAA